MSGERHRLPHIAVIGVVTADRFEGETRTGGAAPYAARALEALGIRARVLTLAGPNAHLDAFEAHERAVVAAARSLCFSHELAGEDRRLRVESRPDRALVVSDLPSDWAGVDTLILGPLLPDDLDVASFAALPVARIALLAQGLQREVAPDGAVTLRTEPSESLLAACDERTSVFLSGEEVAGWPAGAVDRLAASCARVVVTRGAAGADVYRPGVDTLHVEAVAVTPIDTTGAGDAFAAAFVAALACGAADAEAGAIAARVAAATVEHAGPARLPRVEWSVAVGDRAVAR